MRSDWLPNTLESADYKDGGKLEVGEGEAHETR